MGLLTGKVVLDWNTPPGLVSYVGCCFYAACNLSNLFCSIDAQHAVKVLVKYNLYNNSMLEQFLAEVCTKFPKALNNQLKNISNKS